MNILEKLKIDRWFGIVLYLGVLLIAASLFTNVTFIEKKHLFGFGLGAVFIGLSYFIAEKYIRVFKEASYLTGGAGILSTKVIKHNVVSIIVLIIGIVLVGLFGFLIVKALI